MKRLVLAFCVLAVAASTVFADVPDPSKCQTTLDTAQRLLMVPSTTTPYAGATFTVTIRNSANNPINNATVEILVGGLTDSKTKLCGATVATRTTNASGNATFNIGGGGCFKGANACVIRANGVEVRNFSAAVSPDYTGIDNAGIAGRWSLSVALADFGQFAAAFAAGVASCHDYTNDGLTALADFSIFGGTYNLSCTP